jgi:hypothetical protein
MRPTAEVTTTTITRSVTPLPDALLVRIADDTGRWIDVRLSDDGQEQAVLSYSPRFEHERHALRWLSELIPGLLPEGRAAKPTGRNVLGVFQGLGLTHTPNGIRLDRLTQTQRRILELLDIQPPWPEQPDLALTNRGKYG